MKRVLLALIVVTGLSTQAFAQYRNLPLGIGQYENRSQKTTLPSFYFAENPGYGLSTKGSTTGTIGAFVGNPDPYRAMHLNTLGTYGELLKERNGIFLRLGVLGYQEDFLPETAHKSGGNLNGGAYVEIAKNLYNYNNTLMLNFDQMVRYAGQSVGISRVSVVFPFNVFQGPRLMPATFRKPWITGDDKVKGAERSGNYFQVRSALGITGEWIYDLPIHAKNITWDQQVKGHLVRLFYLYQSPIESGSIEIRPALTWGTVENTVQYQKAGTVVMGSESYNAKNWIRPELTVAYHFGNFEQYEMRLSLEPNQPLPVTGLPDPKGQIGFGLLWHLL